MCLVTSVEGMSREASMDAVMLTDQRQEAWQCCKWLPVGLLLVHHEEDTIHLTVEQGRFQL